MKTFKKSKVKFKTVTDDNNVVYEDIVDMLVVDPTEAIVENEPLTFTNDAIYALNGTNNGQVAYPHGTASSNNSYRASGFIDVSNCTSITYLNTPSNNETSVVGLHFYKDNKSPIDEIGYALLTKGEEPQETTLLVPASAHYVRFCCKKEYIYLVYIKLNKNKTVDNFVTVARKVDAIENRIPLAPTAAGLYILKATITNEGSTYSWVLSS